LIEGNNSFKTLAVCNARFKVDVIIISGCEVLPAGLPAPSPLVAPEMDNDERDNSKEDLIALASSQPFSERPGSTISVPQGGEKLVDRPLGEIDPLVYATLLLVLVLLALLFWSINGTAELDDAESALTSVLRKDRGDDGRELDIVRGLQMKKGIKREI
jgi:nitrogen fixation-related uncharacterized protein